MISPAANSRGLSNKTVTISDSREDRVWAHRGGAIIIVMKRAKNAFFRCIILGETIAPGDATIKDVSW